MASHRKPRLVADPTFVFLQILPRNQLLAERTFRPPVFLLNRESAITNRDNPPDQATFHKPR